jgi:hypothetical protein
LDVYQYNPDWFIWLQKHRSNTARARVFI